MDEWPEIHVFNTRPDIVNLTEHPEHWLNHDLDSFLETMRAFLNGITNLHINRGFE